MFDLATALRHMRVIADKPERMRCFHKIVFEIGGMDARQFWDTFWGIWTSSENLFDDFDYFEELVEHGLTLGSPHVGLEPKERAALKKLPAVITVYRGCMEHNQDGWSWTTDREKAMFFAKRAFGGDNHHRQVLKGTVRKTDVLGYLMGRNESEIVVRPDDVMDIEVEEEFHDEGNKTSGIYWAIQSGRFNIGGDKMEEIRALMMVHNMKAVPDEAIKEVEDSLRFAEWGGIESKKSYLEHLVRFMKMKQSDPSSLPPLNSIGEDA